MLQRILTVVLLSVCTLSASAQKKKPAVAKPAKKTVAKSATATAELLPTKAGNKFYLLSGTAKDTLFLKQFDSKAAEPTETTITEFMSKGTRLIAVSWKETAVTKTNMKTENGVTVQTKIFDPATKANVFENNQCTVNISEIQSLGGTQATQTVEKIRREGCECKVLPEGDVTLTGKGRNDRLTYDVKQGKYIRVQAKKK